MTVNFTPADTAAAQWLRSRRTIHNFKPECPPQEEILKAIELARWAPNHYLSEPWRFYLLGNESKQHIVDLNAELVTAQKGAIAGEKKRERWQAVPGWLVVTSLKSADPLRHKEDYAATCCAIHNLSLYLWSQGIGVKWTTGPVTRDNGFYEHLWIDPQAEEVVGLLWYGYPSDIPTAPRQPVCQITLELP